MKTKVKLLVTGAISAITSLSINNVWASPFDSSGVGATGQVEISGSSFGLTVGIVFDTTVQPPYNGRDTRGQKQVDALKNLVRDHLKVGDYIFIESVSRGYNGFFIAQGGGGEGIWSGGLMMTLTRIGTEEEQSHAQSTGTGYGAVAVKSKQAIMDWIHDLEMKENHRQNLDPNESTKPNSAPDWNEYVTGRPSMQGALYMARHMFESAKSISANSTTSYKNVLFIFSDGHFVGSTNPVIRNPDSDNDPETTESLITPPIGDWHVHPSWRDHGVQIKAVKLDDGCTPTQAVNSYGTNQNDFAYQCYDFWNNSHRASIVPLPPTMDTNEEFENHITLRWNLWDVNAKFQKPSNLIEPHGRRSLYFEALCSAQPNANALAVEQSDLLRSMQGVVDIFGFIPDGNPEPQNVAVMQRITWDEGLPDCWIRGSVQGIEPCGHTTGLVGWVFDTVLINGALYPTNHPDYDRMNRSGKTKNNDANVCGGYGFADTNHPDAYRAGGVIDRSARGQRIWMTPDFDGLDDILKRSTENTRGVRITTPTAHLTR